MKVIICGHYGFGNIGDEAILVGLKRFLLETWPRAEFIVWGKWRQFPFGFRTILKSIFRPSILLSRLRELKSCDLFVIGGGGLFTDEEGPFVSTNYILHGFLAHFMNKKVICLGVSIGRLSFWNKFLAKKFFRLTEFNAMRDNASENKLKLWGIKAEQFADFAYYVPREIKAPPEISKCVIVVARNCRRSHSELYKNLAQVCDSIIRDFGLEIMLIPFEPGYDKDEHALSIIFEQMSEKAHVNKYPYTSSFNELIALFSSAKAAIVMRLHAGIFADIAGTPFIPISYMDKVKNFWFGIPNVNSFNLENISAVSILAELDRIINQDRPHRSIKNLESFSILSDRLKFIA